jgi:hypothetical protein
MRSLICFLFALLLVVVAAKAESVKVYIAPRTNSIPVSGKVSFDIYWYNASDRPAAIPALERYSFVISVLAPFAAVGLEGRTVDHPSANRSIAPYATIHDQTAITIDAKPNQLVAVTGEFRGDKSRFKSNTVVLRKAPKT